MKWSDAYQSKYMSKDDLDGGPISLTIEDVRLETIKSGLAEEDKYVMFFREPKAKPLIMNSTNIETIKTAFGNDCDLAVGKVVELYVDPGVIYAGKRVGGVRLRVRNGHAAQAPSGLLTYQQALDLCAGAGISKDEFIDALKNEGLSGYSAKRDTALVRKLVAQAQEVDSSADDETIPF